VQDDFGSDQDPEPADDDDDDDDYEFSNDEHPLSPSSPSKDLSGKVYFHGAPLDESQEVIDEEVIDEEVVEEEDDFVDSDGSFHVDNGDDDSEPQFNRQPFGLTRSQQQHQLQQQRVRHPMAIQWHSSSLSISRLFHSMFICLILAAMQATYGRDPVIESESEAVDQYDYNESLDNF
jgi:hypothetical protein